MEERVEASTPNKRSRLLRLLLLGVFGFGFLVAALFLSTRFEHRYRPEVLNLLGRNPSVKWVGKQAPAMLLPELYTNKAISLSSYRGKVVLIDFWASWCPDCLKSLPMIQRFHNDPKLRGKVKIISVNIKERGKGVRQRIKTFMKRYHYDFPVLLGSMKTVKTFDIWHIPALVVVTPQGKVYYSGAEYHDEKRLRSILLAASRK